MTAEEDTLPVQTDGELLCTEGPRLEIEFLPKYLEVICGPLNIS
jgi:hypothetical protein